MRRIKMAVGVVGLVLLYGIGNPACGKGGKGSGDADEQPFKLVKTTRAFAGYEISGQFPEGWQFKPGTWKSGYTLKLEHRVAHKLEGSIAVSFPSVSDNNDRRLELVTTLMLAAYGGITKRPLPIKVPNPSRLISKVGKLEPGKYSFTFEGRSWERRGARATVSMVAFRLPDTKTGYVRCVSRLWSDQHNWKQLRKVCAALVVKPLGAAARKAYYDKTWKELQSSSVKARKNFCEYNLKRITGPLRQPCIKILWAENAALLKKARTAVTTRDVASFPSLHCGGLPDQAKTLGDPKIIQEVKEMCAAVGVMDWAKSAIATAKTKIAANDRFFHGSCEVTAIEKWTAPATPLTKGLKPKIIDACFKQYAPRVIQLGFMKGGVCAGHIVEAYRGIVRYKLKDKKARAAAAKVRRKCRKLSVQGRTVKFKWSSVK